MYFVLLAIVIDSSFEDHEYECALSALESSSYVLTFYALLLFPQRP